jgi:hypothetical protein
MEHWCKNTDRGKPSTGRKICHSATLSTMNLTWPGLGSNSGLIGDRLVTNSLRHSSQHSNKGCHSLISSAEVDGSNLSSYLGKLPTINLNTSPEHMFAFGVVLSLLTACLDYYDGWCGSLAGQEVIVVTEEAQKLTTQNWNTRKCL